MNEQHFIISESGLLLLERFTKNRDLVILTSQIRAKPIVDVSDNAKLLNIFEHTNILCDEIIKKYDPQSDLGFNALLIKYKIKKIRDDEENNVCGEL